MFFKRFVLHKKEAGLEFYFFFQWKIINFGNFVKCYLVGTWS